MHNLKINFKKFSFLLITCILSFSLISCGKKDEEDNKIEKSNISLESKSSEEKNDEE